MKRFMDVDEAREVYFFYDFQKKITGFPENEITLVCPFITNDSRKLLL